MKFGGVILCQILYHEIIKYSMMRDCHVFMTSSCILGPFGRKKVENPNFFVFHPICLNFGIGEILRCLLQKENPN